MTTILTMLPNASYVYKSGYEYSNSKERTGILLLDENYVIRDILLFGLVARKFRATFHVYHINFSSLYGSYICFLLLFMALTF